MGQYEEAVRAHAITMMALHVPFEFITAKLGCCKRQVLYWKAHAKERSYNPAGSIVLKNEYLTDKPRPGRPRKQPGEAGKSSLEAQEKDRYAREKSAAQPGYDFGVSDIPLPRVYKTNNIRKFKPSRRP